MKSPSTMSYAHDLRADDIGSPLPETTDLFTYTSGPRNADVLLVGEAWGVDEALHKRPFVGEAGRVLDKLLEKSGFTRNSILLTNVVHDRPPGNDFRHYLVQKGDRKSVV